MFAVDFMPVGIVARARHDRLLSAGVGGRDQARCWRWTGNRLIPGHPGAPAGRLGTKKDVQDTLTFLQEASAAVKAEARRANAGIRWRRK